MKRDRTFWLSVLLFALLLGGVGAALWWPDSKPALDCPPEEVVLVDAGTGLVAVCSPDGGTPLPAAWKRTVGAKLDLNRATEAELAAIPEIGPALARALVDARDVKGGFSTWDEVDEVRGVGPAKLQALQASCDIRP